MTDLKKILYVEDEADIQTVASIALKTVGGFELLICSSGEQAIENAVSFLPDLLLLDIMMPGMDGPSTLKALWQLPELSKVPAIFMTAKVQPAEINEYKALGALDVIAKPFDPMTLAQQIETVWQQRNNQ
ncbi:MAG: response regulator [Gammaproteobacteria bacterium]|nr:response regulator [Gammaproteobacteria bacterium]